MADRLGQLLDAHSPFLELSPLAADGVYGKDAIPGAGMITGIGRIHGRECMVVVNDATVKGGSYYPLTVSSSCVYYWLHKGGVDGLGCRSRSI